MENAKQKHVLVIGAGFAGMNATQRLAGQKNVRVTLVDKNNFHLFQPLLYQVASTGLNPSEISAVVRRSFRRQKNVKVLRATLTALDKQSRVATFNDGDFSLEYDYLILCIGGKTCYFGNDQWEEVAPGLKSLEDAVTIRNRLLKSLEQAERKGEKAEFEHLTSVVVIGGGPTGVELAGAFAELRSKVLARDYRAFDPKEIQVFLIEAGPALLSGYDEKSSVYTKKRLERLGVKVFLNERVTDIDAKGVTTQEQFFSSSNIIWAAGVEGHPLAKMATDKLDPRGRILVTPELLIEGETDIFACGDMTYFGHDERFPRGLPGVAPAAMQQGQRAAKNIIALINGTETKPFEYFDKGKMATIGRSAAVAEAGRMKMRGFLAWCAWLFIHLLYLVEFQDRIIVFMRWIWSYLTWQWGVRIIFDASDADSGQIVSASSSEPSDTNSTGQTSQTESPSNLSEDKQADTTVTQESNVDKELPPDPQVKQPHDLSSSDESAAEEEPPVDAVDEIETEAPSSTRDENDLKATATESS